MMKISKHEKECSFLFKLLFQEIGNNSGIFDEGSPYFLLLSSNTLYKFIKNVYFPANE